MELSQTGTVADISEFQSRTICRYDAGANIQAKNEGTLPFTHFRAVQSRSLDDCVHLPEGYTVVCLSCWEFCIWGSIAVPCTPHLPMCFSRGANYAMILYLYSPGPLLYCIAATLHGCHRRRPEFREVNVAIYAVLETNHSPTKPGTPLKLVQPGVG